MDRTDEQQKAVDKNDYIDIMAFLRAFFRYARRYAVFALVLSVFMAVCVSGGMALLKNKLIKKTYIARGNYSVGVLLSDSIEYDYDLLDLGSNKSDIVSQTVNYVKGLADSDYMKECIRKELELEPDDELNGEISTEAATLTNLINVSVSSDSKEDAEAIRDAYFALLTDRLFPIIGYVEIRINNVNTDEIESSLEFLGNPVVWVILGIIPGIFMYLGLILLYTIFWSHLETPEEVSEITQIPCLAQLPVRKRKKGDDYKNSFVGMRRRISEEAEKGNVKTLLLTGINNKKFQSAFALELESQFREQGKQVVLTDFDESAESLTAESVQKKLDDLPGETDLVLIDGPLCGPSAAPLILADCADGVIYMIEQGNAGPQRVKEMHESLQFARAESIGFVLYNCDYIEK